MPPEGSLTKPVIVPPLMDWARTGFDNTSARQLNVINRIFMQPIRARGEPRSYADRCVSNHGDAPTRIRLFAQAARGHATWRCERTQGVDSGMQSLSWRFGCR